MKVKRILFLSFISILTSCSVFIPNDYAPSVEDKEKIIYRNNLPASQIEVEGIESIISFKERKYDLLIFDVELKNQSKNDILITPRYFHLLDKERVIPHVDYQEDLSLQKSDINRQERDIKTNSLQDIGSISADFISLFQTGEDYKEYEERRSEEERRLEKAHKKLFLSKKEYEKKLQVYPLRQTLLKGESKKLTLVYSLEDNPEFLTFMVGQKKKELMRFKKIK